MDLGVETIWARGHVNVSATHRNTIEVTRDDYVTRRGDCIIACCADKAASDLLSIKRVLASHDVSMVIMVIVAGSSMEVVVGLGVRWLKLSDAGRIVARRSGYIDGSTVMIAANKAAKDLGRDLVNKARDGEPIGVVLLATGIE